MKTTLDGPGLPELGVGLAAFGLFLVPTVFLLAPLGGHPVLQGVIGAALGGLGCIGAFAAACSLRLRALRPFGFRPVAPRWLLVGAGLGVLGYGLNLIIQFAYLALFGVDDPQGILHAAARGGVAPFLMLLLAAAVLTPFGEEILFRGVVANALNRYGAWAGVGLSSVVFGLVHGVSVILPVAIMVGLLAAVLFRRTGSVWPCVVLHCVYNGVNVVASALGFAPMS